MKTSSTLVEHIPVPPPPWGDISTDIAPTPMEALDGEFAIATALKGKFLTAVNGGGKTTDVIHTDAIHPQAWESFKFWVDIATGQYSAFQTVNGHFITAVDAGGLTTDTIHSDATMVARWEMFKLLPQSAFPTFAIQTLRGFLLTAVGGGGHDSGDTIHTDAVNADTWERFHIFRRSEFGSGSTYGIQAFGGNLFGSFLVAVNGGGLSGGHVLSDNSGVPFWISWRLLNQYDGTYAFQTASGWVLTANGGGIPGEGFRTDTGMNQIGNFEKFTLIDNGDFTAYIKTFVGTYLTDEGNGLVTTVTNVNQATRWRFWVFNL